MLMPLVSASRSVMQCKERKVERRRRRRTRDMATYFLRNPILSFQSLLLPAEAFLSNEQVSAHLCFSHRQSSERNRFFWQHREYYQKPLAWWQRGKFFWLHASHSIAKGSIHKKIWKFLRAFATERQASLPPPPPPLALMALISIHFYPIFSFAIESCLLLLLLYPYRINPTLCTKHVRESF